VGGSEEKSNSQKELKKKITERAGNIAVIGLGYVGLPLAVEKAKIGFPVTGIDKAGGKN